MLPVGPFITLSEVECWAIVAAFVFMGFDVVCGLVGALVRHEYKSGTMRDGLGHKAMVILVVALAFLVQGFTSHVAEIGFDIPLIVPVCVYVVVMEVGSILETVKETVPDLADSPLFRFFEKREGTDA